MVALLCSSRRMLAPLAVVFAVSTMLQGCSKEDDGLGEFLHASSTTTAKPSSTCRRTVSEPARAVTRYCNDTTPSPTPLPEGDGAVLERYQRGEDVVSATLAWNGSTYKTLADGAASKREVGGYLLRMQRVSGVGGLESVCAIYYAAQYDTFLLLNADDGSCPQCNNSKQSSTAWLLLDQSFEDALCP